MKSMSFRNLKRINISRSYSNLSYIHNPGTEPLRHLTVGKLLELSAENFGDRPALISKSQNQVLSFQETLIKADKLAAGLRTIGLTVGDLVGVWAPNTSEWYIIHMACARGGFVLVNINPALQPQELESCVNAVGVKALLCTHKFKSRDYYENLLELAPEITKSEPGELKSVRLPCLGSIIFSSNESLRGCFNFQEILDLSTEHGLKQVRKLQDYINPDSIAHLQFTSGTTGKSKAPMQSHFQLVNNSYFVGKRNELDRKHQIACMLVPFFHAFGTVVSLCGALNHGSTLVLPAVGYDPDKALNAIRDEKCTIIYGTPTMYVDLVDRQKVRKEEISLEIAVCGGACCSPHLFKEMKNILGLKKVKSVYGLTEATAVAFQSLHDDDEYRSTSTVGYVGEHLEVKVVDQQGHAVPRGQPGELCIRGYSTTLGYWQNEKSTKELIGADKWLKTGDQFVMENDGYGRVVGRLKDMIIRGGENIFPAEIEDYINSHPSILETQVIGIPHERLGEEVCAVIRVQPNTSLTLEDVRSYCTGKMSHYKIPSKLKVVESFPKTASGKIQKYKLVEILNK